MSGTPIRGLPMVGRLPFFVSWWPDVLRGVKSKRFWHGILNAAHQNRTMPKTIKFPRQSDVEALFRRGDNARQLFNVLRELNLQYRAELLRTMARVNANVRAVR